MRSWVVFIGGWRCATSGFGQSGGGAQAGGEFVPDVARGLDERATMPGRGAGEPESFCGGSLNRVLEWAACLPSRVGSLQHEPWEPDPKRWVARPRVR